MQVTVLVEREAACAGTIAASSNESVELLSEHPAPAGSAVKLESDGALFLGEVSSCKPSGQGFSIWIELRHALYNTEELARFARRILEEDGPR